jgi:hypothetical protein
VKSCAMTTGMPGGNSGRERARDPEPLIAGAARKEPLARRPREVHVQEDGVHPALRQEMPRRGRVGRP